MCELQQLMFVFLIRTPTGAPATTALPGGYGVEERRGILNGGPRERCGEFGAREAEQKQNKQAQIYVTTSFTVETENLLYTRV